eukprot:CAMPEP_0194491940 /NCGR_PEP_ID=MMETSP0253-20130528/10671_1 /TAXON_ID=2966 /ORGANISM="Noctiluca scintillans" /LENGTH=40 /DNA_ID= /DNA_START= /DNA_END= /DNA_ORIENTATION=
MMRSLMSGFASEYFMKIIPALEQRSDLYVLVVTTSQCSKG